MESCGYGKLGWDPKLALGGPESFVSRKPTRPFGPGNEGLTDGQKGVPDLGFGLAREARRACEGGMS